MHTYIHSVKYYETDKMGITHHSNYVRWMEEARTDFLKNAGYGIRRLEKEGVTSPVVSLECQYKHPLFFHQVRETALDPYPHSRQTGLMLSPSQNRSFPTFQYIAHR